MFQLQPVMKNKERRVAKGYVQKQGIDSEVVFAPVTRIEIVRLLLALEAKNSWEVHHLDVKSACLNVDLQEDVYITQPEGFVEQGKEHLVYKLIKALSGLRQSPQAWYAKLSNCLELKARVSQNVRTSMHHYVISGLMQWL